MKVSCRYSMPMAITRSPIRSGLISAGAPSPHTGPRSCPRGATHTRRVNVARLLDLHSSRDVGLGGESGLVYLRRCSFPD
jgi:hypothetical protein